MKGFRLSGLLIAIVVTAAAVAQYPKQGVRLLSRIPLAEFQGSPTSGAGCAWYVSPSGQEYAIMGVRNGTAIVRITNPLVPQIVAHIAGTPSTWHEMVTCGEYLYTVADGADQGLQIVDLRQIDQGIVPPIETYTTGGIQRVHTIQANPATKMVYLNGGSGTGVVMLDVTTPMAPVEVARWTTKYVHDSQIKSFTTGPYAGKEIGFFCCGGSGLYIVDLTNKSNLVTLSNVPYLTGSYYSHSGQLTEDGKYFLINDEFDERNSLVSNCTTHIVDVSNLSQPIYKGGFINPIGVIDHNSQIVGNTLYLAAYRAGLRVYDISNPLQIKELGYFDTYPTSQGFSFDGAWGTAVFPSGNAIISDINRGLFMLDPSEALGKGAPLTELSVLTGDLQSGSLASLRHADQNSLVLNAGVDSPEGSRLFVKFHVSAVTSITPSALLDFSVAAGPNAEVRVDLWNWTTGKFDRVGIVHLSPGNPTGTLSGISGTAYVSSGGEIKAEIMGIPPLTGSREMLQLSFDQVKFNIRRS